MLMGDNREINDVKREIFERLKEHRFETIAEVDKYLSTDRIECLVCGKMFQLLGLHLSAIHGIDRMEYRLALNIPATKVLSCGATRKRMSLAQKTELNSRLMRDHEIRKKAVSRRIQVKSTIVEMTKRAAVVRGRVSGAILRERRKYKDLTTIYGFLKELEDASK